MGRISLNTLMEREHPRGGQWELGPGHSVQYRVNGDVENITLKGTPIDVEPFALLVAVQQKQKNQNAITQVYRLGGKWRLDDEHHIVFDVKKKDASHDVLQFKGTWRVGKNNEIVYTYDTTELKTKKRIDRSLVFKGLWSWDDRHRLTYFLKKESNSAFRVRGAFQTHSILAKRGELRYQLGGEIRGRHYPKVLVLFGKWKFSRKTELSFEIEYKDGMRDLIRFGAKYQLKDDQSIAVNLLDHQKEPLGIEIVFTKDLIENGGEAFVRLARDLEETRVEAGLKVAW